MKTIISTFILFSALTAYSQDFTAIQSNYEAATTLQDRDLLLASAWAGHCFTAAEPTVVRSGLLLTYTATAPYRFPFATLALAGSAHTANHFNELSQEEVRTLASERQKNAWPVVLFLNEASFIQGRGYEPVTIRADKNDAGEFSAIYTLTKCIADADTCERRGTAAGEWRYCEFKERKF